MHKQYSQQRSGALRHGNRVHLPEQDGSVPATDGAVTGKIPLQPELFLSVRWTGTENRDIRKAEESLLFAGEHFYALYFRYGEVYDPRYNPRIVRNLTFLPVRRNAFEKCHALLSKAFLICIIPHFSEIEQRFF